MSESAKLDLPANIPANTGLAADDFERLLGDVPLRLTVELGRVTLSLRELSERLGPGSIISLTKLTGEHLDVRINERLVARAEAVAIGDRYGIRILEIVSGEGKQS